MEFMKVRTRNENIRTALFSICVAFVGALSLYFIFSRDLLTPVSEEPENTPTVTISLPLERTVLYDMQTFSVYVDEVGPENVSRVAWMVDGGVRVGEMYRDAGSYADEVDVSEWNWSKDNAYTLRFVAYDSEGSVLAEGSRVVFAGVRPEFTDEGTTLGDDMLAAAVSEQISPSSPEKTPVTVTLPEEKRPLVITRIEGSAEDHITQRFVLSSEVYDPLDISAFWQVEGGHKNFVFERTADGDHVAGMNFSGWHWRGDGPYQLSFVIIRKSDSVELGREDVRFVREHVDGKNIVSIEGVLPAKTEPVSRVAEDVSQGTEETVSAKESLPVSNIVSAYRSFASRKLFVPEKPAIEGSLMKADIGEEEKSLVRPISQQPTALWLNGDGYDNDRVLGSVVEKAHAEGSVPVFVLYNIPDRDCGSFSSGGARETEAYKAWVDRIRKRIQNIESIIIIEPDALAQLNCLPEEKRQTRVELIRYAAESFSEIPKAHVYIDAGHPFWVRPEEMADRLRSVSVQQTSGFSLNVSNFVRTEDNISYGSHLSNLLDGKTYVVDTSRNGNGPDADLTWCNPRGRALGETPRIVGGKAGLDAYLWIKVPGESDGTCNGGPSAGGWWFEYALELVRNSLQGS